MLKIPAILEMVDAISPSILCFLSADFSFELYAVLAPVEAIGSSPFIKENSRDIIVEISSMTRSSPELDEKSRDNFFLRMAHKCARDGAYRICKFFISSAFCSDIRDNRPADILVDVSATCIRYYVNTSVLL